MARGLPLAPSSSPFERYAARFDDLSSARVQRDAFRATWRGCCSRSSATRRLPSSQRPSQWPERSEGKRRGGTPSRNNEHLTPGDDDSGGVKRRAKACPWCLGRKLYCNRTRFPSTRSAASRLIVYRFV